MPADARARSSRHFDGAVDADEFARYTRATSRVERAGRSACATATLIVAVMFAVASLWLLRSADPFTAFAPALIAAGLVWCACESFPGVRVEESAVESAASAGRGGQAPAHVE